jgi:hypothetical protein
VVTSTESATEHKEIALAAFLDIEGAFDRTSFEVIMQAAERYGTESTICRWICSMLESRNIVWRNLEGDHSQGMSTRGLSPLLWSLVVDELIWELNDSGYYTVGHADNIAILISGKFLQTVSEVLQTALCTVQQWCKKTYLSINSSKMIIIPFTRKRNIRGLKEPILFNNEIQLLSGVE